MIGTPETHREELDFGDYVEIEQLRYGVENEMYLHKVIGRSESNTFVDVPVTTPATEKIHGSMEEVVSCICCGVLEIDVRKYRVADVRTCPASITEGQSSTDKGKS